MLEAKQMDGSVWLSPIYGEMLTVTFENGKYVGRTDRYDIESTSFTKIQKEIKKLGFEFTGWD